MNPVAFNPEWSPLPASFENPDDIEARAKGLCQESNYCEAIPLYEKLVELNHPKAKLELGRCLYIRGWPSDATFVEKILNEAAAECSFEAHYWLWKLNGSIQVLYAGAWLGDPKCQHALALEYYRGEQYSEAIKWARLSAASDYLPAHEFLASMSGLSLSPNHNFQNYFQAYYDLNKMTSKYDFQLGTAYLNGYGVFPDAQRALDHLLKAADQGDAHACYWVGQYYLDGDLVSKDLAKAVEYFTKASDSGFMAAKWELANLLLEGGEGVEKDVFKAVELLNQISDSRDPKFASASLNLLGHYYLTLSMTAKAMDCFFFASRDYDHPLASLRLGVMYYERSGIKAGEPFFEKAHQLGVAEATFYLGKLSLADGDKESAVKFFKKAAKQGVAGAYFEMGRMLETEEKGKGVPLIIKSLQKGYNPFVLKIGSTELAPLSNLEKSKEEIRLCFLAGKKDCVQAFELLGKHYASYESHELAFGFFNKAEALGSSLAYGRLGEYHLGAHGVVEKNETLAHEYFRKGVEKGDVYSCEWSALEAIKKNREETAQMYRRANTPWAIYHLALLEESDELMVEAANLGYLPAMESLADSGEEEEDYDKMKLWLQRAAHWGCIGSAERLIAEYSEGKLFEKDLDKAVYYSIFLDDVADSTEIYQEQKREIAQLLSENSSFLEKAKSRQKKIKKKFRQQLDRLSPKHSAEFISELEIKIGVEYGYYLNKISTQVGNLSRREIGEIKEFHERAKRYESKFTSRCNAIGEKCLRDLEKKLAEELDEEKNKSREAISALAAMNLSGLKERENKAALPFQRAQGRISELQSEANKRLSQSDSVSATKRIIEAFQADVKEVLASLAPSKTVNGNAKKEREIEILERQIEKERQKHASEVEQLRAEMAAQSRTSPTIKPVQHEKTGFLADYERCFTLLSVLDGEEYEGLQTKQLESALRESQWKSVEQLGQLLERVGFEWEQNGTSHRVYRFPRNKELMISLSFDNKDRALVVYRKQVLNLLVKALEFYSTTI